MRPYRSFFVLSLCTHILLLAFAATLGVFSPSHPLRPRLNVTIFQKPIPLPVGEPSAPPGGGKPSPTSEPEPEQVVTQPPPKKKPKPPKTRKPPPQPPRQIVKPAPKAEPPPLAASPPAIAEETAGEAYDGSSAGSTSVAAKGGQGKAGSGQGKSLGGTGSGSGGGGGGGLLARPNYGVNPKPPYPLIARRVGAEGVVVLRVRVHADGSVAAVMVKESSGFSMLDESALRTVRDRWRFLPARLDGKPVESWVEVPIRFVLAGS